VGVRGRKSFKVAPGVRVRLNAKSASVTVGGQGAHYTVNSNGGRTATVGVAGVSVQHQSGGRRGAESRSSAQPPGRQAVRQAPAGTSGRNRLTKRGWTIILTILAIILAIVVVVKVHSSHPAKIFPPIPEDLKLSGRVSGRLTTATEVEGMTSSFPGGPSGEGSGFGPTDATACVQNKGEGWEVDLYGRVGTKEISLSFDGDDLYGSNMAGNYIGTHDLDNSASSGGIMNLYVGSTDIDEVPVGSATLVVNPDGRSGTMNLQLQTDLSGKDSEETITGSWRCA